MDDLRGEFRENREVDRKVAAWIGFWVQFGVLFVLAGVGAFFADRGGAPGDYACGMALVIGAAVLAFLRLKHHFDGRSLSWADFVLVDSMWGLGVAVPLFTIIALCGLFLAHDWGQGAPYNAGLGLFVISALIIFFDIKRVYDRRDRRGH